MTEQQLNQFTESSNNEFLRAIQISKSFGAVSVLNEVSFSLQEREILGIIGPSGCGKTTLLRCLDMLEIINQGFIDYYGIQNLSITPEGISRLVESANGDRVSISEEEISELRKDIGFVFQGFNLWEERSVLGNLILAPMVVQRQSREIAEEKARELCHQFGLEDKIEAKGWQLSGGQKQRVAIIRALMMEPKLMLLDEITSSLDPVLTVDVMEAIKQLRERGLTMIIVSHHIEFVSSICDRIMFLSQGRIIQIDTPENLRESPATIEVKRFLEILGEAR